MKNNTTLIEFKDSDSISIGPLYQWDKGQVFQFVEKFPSGTEVQFDDGSTKVIVESIVKVPNKLLQIPGNHNAWFQVIGPDDETTVKYIRFMVKPRQRKNDYIEPEDEQTFREDIQSIMNQTKDIAESVRKDADTGKFKGEKGEKGDKGDQGIPGLVIPANGMFSFFIKDGNLIVVYNSGDTPPSLYIDKNGCLIFGEKEDAI